MKCEGKVWKFGDDIDTDLIIPARFLNVSDEKSLAENCFADVRPGFAQNIGPGDIIVAGRNFGCGSSREHAPIAIKGAGISMVIAKSFARIFYRNAFNIGLPIVESEAAVDVISEGDWVSVDLEAGTLKTENDSESFVIQAIPAFMREIIRAGGLVDYVKQRGLK
ncbi:MAG: 3-isopropylmalate dehydratase small subunit [Desulfatiglans sp.]|jgi:3-isopropylmalate/(R)-2-methylmalate dehydratase small subunit|nr:3-isopropylmalate dehydratase small subunit [Desulfatiglans sp.]